MMWQTMKGDIELEDGYFLLKVLCSQLIDEMPM